MNAIDVLNFYNAFKTIVSLSNNRSKVWKINFPPFPIRTAIGRCSKRNSSNYPFVLSSFFFPLIETVGLVFSGHQTELSENRFGSSRERNAVPSESDDRRSARQRRTASPMGTDRGEISSDEQFDSSSSSLDCCFSLLSTNRPFRFSRSNNSTRIV